MTSGVRGRPDRRFGIADARPVADHAARPFGQTPLDRPVQIGEGITELANHIQNRYLNGVASSRPDRDLGRLLTD